MLAYAGKFSDVSSNLRRLTKKDTVWVWDANSQRDFENLKKILISSPTSKYFDINKNVVSSADTPQSGLKAVLLQENLPVAYASKAFTQTETRYAQIEKESLAIDCFCM